MLLKKLSKAAAVCAVVGMALAMVSCGDRNDGTYLTQEALEDEGLKLGGTWKLTGGYVYYALKDSEEGMWYVWDNEEGAPVAAQKVTDLDIVAGEFEYIVSWRAEGSSSDDSEDSALHFDNSLCLTLTDAQAKEMLKGFLSYIEDLEGLLAEMREEHTNTSDSFEGDVRGHVMLSADHTRIDMYVYYYSEENMMNEDGEEIFDGVKGDLSFTLTRQ